MLDGITLKAARLVAASLVVFAASGLVAAALRRALPAEWLLPLVPVAHAPRGRGAVGG
ncbi:MAG TPA: hypothetical protein PLE61_13405 [Vicinamibacterales bacterium]|nr:hypothetical protein [Vicinamibacterales bacterium]HPW21797.1 hypothetical protein [Vicinamibacterales bacterium]